MLRAAVRFVQTLCWIPLLAATACSKQKDEAAATQGAPSAPAAAVPTPSATVSAAPAACEQPCLSIERCEAGKCVPNCPEGEVYVPPSGPEGFVMGTGRMLYGFGKYGTSRKGLTAGDAKHRVVITMPYCIDATEVTAGAYARCIEKDGCPKPGTKTQFNTYPGKADHPINMTGHDFATHYCRSVGKELPTEAQWAWAASGGDGRKYPWGDEAPTCDHADFTAGPIDKPAGDYGCRGGGPSPVGSMPKGDRVLPTGRIHELAGNVWEWTLDAYHRFPPGQVTDPLNTDVNGMNVIRGGGWNRSFLALRVTFRGGEPIDYKVSGLGFRCARTPKEHTALWKKIEEYRKNEAAWLKVHFKNGKRY